MLQSRRRRLRLRPFIFWPHLAVGLTAGLVILVMSVTGVLLMYQKQMQSWAERGYWSEPAPGATRLPVAALVEAVTRAYPGASATTITVRTEPAAPVTIAISGGQTVSVNPYTGAVLGEGAVGLRTFFRNVTNWHRYLAVEGDGRVTARALTGAANLIFVFLALSGLYLWWPRASKMLRNITWFRRGLTSKARDFNWHHVFGFWMALPIVLIAGSGTVISYTWASNLIYRVAGEEPPPAAGSANTGRGGGGAGRAGGGGARGGGARGGGAAGADVGRPAGGEASLSGADLDGLLTKAEARQPGWQTVSFRVPTGPAPLAFTIDRGNGGQPQLRSTLTLNPRTGDEIKYETFPDQTRGRRWRSWARFLHTGEAAGVLGQSLAGLASFAGVVLVYSGLALAYRRFFSRSLSRSSR